MSVAATVISLGGIATRAQLESAGHSGHDIESALDAGSVRRVRRGWYSTLPAADPRVVAVRHGGALTGLSALVDHGCWAWNAPRVVDVVLPRGRRARMPGTRSVRLTFDPAFHAAAGIVDLQSALVHAIPRLPFEEAVAALDWAVHSGHLDMITIHDVAARLPARCRGITEWVDPGCGSVLESIVRTRLRLLGFHVTSQVPVDPLGEWGVIAFIDLVVDGVVGLELDGRKDHAARFELDRRKDAAITRGGRTALRASYRMVRDDWPLVEAAVRHATAQHRRRRTGVGPRNRPPAWASAVPWQLPRRR